MPYTTQGYMTWDDIRDWEADTDNGVIDILISEPPEWFDTAGICPIDGKPTAEHGSVTVTRAGGTIVGCT